MPPITITEKDFRVLAAAAMDAEASGDEAQAKALDRLARMANAALCASNQMIQAGRMLGGRNKRVRWQDMPSTINLP